MKAMVCEMCSGTDIIKDGDFFVCQSCGTKYTVESAKKLMIEVEGTIKVDNSEKVAKLLKAAQMARKSDDTETAKKNYDLVLEEDPEQWEAVFFSVYYKAEKTNILNMAGAMSSVDKCLPNVFRMIKEKISDETEQEEAVQLLLIYILKLGTLMDSVARNQFSENYNVQYDQNLRRFKEYANRSDAVSSTYQTFATCIHTHYSENEKLLKLQAAAEKACIQLRMDKNYVYDEPEKNNKLYTELAEEYIIPIEPEYTLPEPNTNGFPAWYQKQINKALGKGGNEKSGCYVATCVYGSYDCPQVWTLRRFRDDTLAATWYGRAFIRTYYTVSPTLVKWFGGTKWFRKMWKAPLDRMVHRLNNKGIADTPYRDKKW